MQNPIAEAALRKSAKQLKDDRCKLKIIPMKKINFLLVVLCSVTFVCVTSSKSLANTTNTSIRTVSLEITYEEWVLFFDIMNLANGAEARNFTKNTNPNKYTASNPKDKVQLSQEDADFLQQWLTKNGKEITYLQQILQEIANAPAPTSDAVGGLCSSLMRPEQDNSASSVGMNYHRDLWELAGAKPKIDPTEVGRVKVQRYWNKYKKELRCPSTGTRDTDELSVAKHPMDTSGIRFVRELAIAYKVDFNFVDQKDGLTVLDFVQKRIYQANRLVPKPEATLIEFQAVYDAIVKTGGKHSENWLKKADSYK